MKALTIDDTLCVQFSQSEIKQINKVLNREDEKIFTIFWSSPDLERVKQLVFNIHGKAEDNIRNRIFCPLHEAMCRTTATKLEIHREVNSDFL